MIVLTNIENGFEAELDTFAGNLRCEIALHPRSVVIKRTQLPKTEAPSGKILTSYVDLALENDHPYFVRFLTELNGLETDPTAYIEFTPVSPPEAFLELQGVGQPFRLLDGSRFLLLNV